MYCMFKTDLWKIGSIRRIEYVRLIQFSKSAFIISFPVESTLRVQNF